MPQTGELIIRVYLSQARLPIPGVTAIVTAPQPDGSQHLAAVRFTDQSGVAPAIELYAPALSGSLQPSADDTAPFSTYTLLVEHPDYQLALFERLQVFPGITTIQDVPLLPLSDRTDAEGRQADTVLVTPQPL